MSEISDNNSAEPQPWELAYRFMRELERPEMLLRTDLPNALGCFDTVNWGAASKKAIVAALRDALDRAAPELMRTRDGMQTCSNCGERLHAGEAIQQDGKGGWRHPSKCGNELRDLAVRRPPRTERK